jgi:threonine aldolase
MAARLAAGVATLPGLRLTYPVEGNGVFAELSAARARALQADWMFHVWSAGGDGRCVVRWMTAFDTAEADVDALVAAVAASS